MHIFTAVGAADLEQIINALSLNAVLLGSVMLVVLVGLSILLAAKKPKLKKPLFISIAAVVVGTTLTIAGGTVYLNIRSASGGPVHWHADMEIWACGNELNLRDPTGLSNKIGTPTLHEHNDKRIHLEGVPVNMPYDASLGKFMDVVGGELSGKTLVVPLNPDADTYFQNAKGQEDGDGNGAPSPEQMTPFIHDQNGKKVASFVNGQKCGDQEAQVQAFAYRYNNSTNTYAQTKLDNPATYAISHESDVPPGDCVIIEFAPLKTRTEKLCRTYGVKDINRCEAFGVPAEEHSRCTSREVTASVCAEQAKNALAGITAECDALNKGEQ